MADVTTTRETVESILANMLDPETGRSLARMDQIRQINIDGRGVEVTLGPHNVVEPPLGGNSQRSGTTATRKAPAGNERQRANHRVRPSARTNWRNRPNRKERNRRRRSAVGP